MKKRLLSGEIFEFAGNENVLETFFSERLNKFCMMFNAKLYTFKTFEGFKSKFKDLTSRFGINIPATLKFY